MVDTLTIIGILAGFIFGGVLGLVGGYYFGKSRAYQSTDLSTQSGLISQLNIQLAEVKTKFAELEKRREEVDKERQKTEEEREKRLQLFLSGTQNTMQTITSSVAQFQRVIFGTKQRGESGEEILKTHLKEQIKVGMIKTNVNTGNGVVEFALDLGDGKFLPIDSKLPDVFELMERLEKEEEPREQNAIKKELKKKIESCIDDVAKYVNQPKTVDKCILAVPDNLIDMFPELTTTAIRKNVCIAGYSFTYLLAHTLYDEYQRYRAEGDLGEYKKNVKVLFAIIDEIQKKTETIERGLKMAEKANIEISDNTRRAKREAS